MSDINYLHHNFAPNHSKNYSIIMKRLFTLFAFSCFALYAQTSISQSIRENSNEQSDQIVIYLNETLSGSSLGIDKDDSWVIMNDQTGQTLLGTGENIYQNSFSTPGSYMIRFTHTDACGQEHGQENKLVRLIVLPYKVKFLFAEAAFSTPLEDNISLSDEMVSVPFTLEYFGKSIPEIPEFAVRAAGIGAELQGTAKTEKIFTAGRNTYEFTLNGTLKSGTYVRLDFIDKTNNIVQPFYYPVKIK